MIDLGDSVSLRVLVDSRRDIYLCVPELINYFLNNAKKMGIKKGDDKGVEAILSFLHKVNDDHCKKELVKMIGEQGDYDADRQD